jgi:hypothetical protein
VYDSPASSHKCLIDHLQPLQRWRISQLDVFLRLSRMKRFLYILGIFSFGWLVLGIRMIAFSLQIMYSIISACASRAIEFMIRSSQKLINHPQGNSGTAIAVHERETNELSLPDSEQDITNRSILREGLSDSSSSLSQIAETLQIPSILKFRRDIEALSAPVAQPRATFHFVARMWLKLCIFVSSCDAALDQWYLNRVQLLQEDITALDSQKAEANRATETAVEQQKPHSFELLPTPGSGEMPAQVIESVPVPTKIVATTLRLRRPREPWMLLWGNLHVPKPQQVFLVHL